MQKVRCFVKHNGDKAFTIKYKIQKMKETHLVLLEHASNEIKHLRRQNELMSARLGMFDDMMRLLHSNLNYDNSGMMSPDWVYEIDKYLESQKTQTSL